MSNVKLTPFALTPENFKVEVDGEWIASIHRFGNGSNLVHMFWSEHGHPDAEIHNLPGGLPAAYQWAMQMHRKYPEWNRPGR